MALGEQFPANRFRYMRFCGIYERPTVASRFRLWYTFFLHCFFFPLHLVYIVQIQADSDLMETCEEIMLIQVCMTVMLKFNLFFSDREQMYALVESFKSIHVLVGAEERRLFAECNDIHRKLARIYITGTTIVATLYALNAVSATVTESLQHGALRFVTPMNFPYNYQHPAVFAVSFMYNIDTMLMTMCISMTVDTCYSEMANNLALHFDIVGKRFAALDFPAAGNAATRTAAAVAVERELIALIAYHGEVLDLAGRMVRRFQQIVFFLLLLTSTILCVLGYEFVVLMSVSKRLQVMAMAGVFTSQAVIYTYNGSIITDKSAKVAEAIYACNWYEARPAVKKLIHICLARAQKPVVMKGGFIEATLPTLKKILSSTGSYITMLLSLESDA